MAKKLYCVTGIAILREWIPEIVSTNFDHDTDL